MDRNTFVIAPALGAALFVLAFPATVAQAAVADEATAREGGVDLEAHSEERITQR